VTRFAAIVVFAACVPATSELRAPVDREIMQRLGGEPARTVDDLLAKPLDASSAIRIAIANSPRLRAAFDELGIAGGELASALELGPLDIEAMYRRGDGGSELEIDAIQNVLGLVTAPRRRAAAHADLAQARAHATAAAMRLAANVQIAFDDLIAATQDVELRRTAFDAADAAATLRERMFDAGNTSELARARDRAAREQSRVDLARAEADVEARRATIDALLGLSGAQTAWTATGSLGGLPAAAPSLDGLEASAVAASLDLVEAGARVDAAANRLGDRSIRAVLPELGAGVSIIDRDSRVEVGPAVRIGIPLFDQGRGQRATAAAELRRGEDTRSAVAIELRARARAARVAALASYAEARHLRDIVVPLRQQIVDETLLHVNAMDADPFQLIAARRDLADAGHQYLDALRRYWNAIAEVTALQRGVMVESP
jgi:outer membrane protein TolC